MSSTSRSVEVSCLQDNRDDKSRTDLKDKKEGVA